MRLHGSFSGGRNLVTRSAEKHVVGALMWGALVAMLLGQATIVAARMAPPGVVPRRAAGLAARAAAPEFDDLAPIRAAMGARSPQRPAVVRRQIVRVAPPRGGDVEIFGGLGAWVDVYDLHLDPVRASALMLARGVRTLFIETGHYSTRDPIDRRVWIWLRAAHAAGLKVVGWYLPGYSAMSKDIKRTVAIATVSYLGERFDGLGIDIEWRRGVRSRGEWNRRVVAHARAVRRAVGRFPVAAITPSPLQMRVAPAYWAGFPWHELAASSDAIMTMSYWSYRKDCPAKRLHCAYEYTKNDVWLARKLTGGRVPIHVIGGVGDAITSWQVKEFARGAREAHAFGASLYDFGTTLAPYWGYLFSLRWL